MKTNSLSELKGYLIESPNYLSNLLFAIYFLLASPILLDISRDTGLDPGNLSLIFTLYTIGGITGQLTSVFYSRKFRRVHIIIASFIILIPITIILFFTYSLIMFYVLYFLAGYLLGIVWIQANANVFESKVKNKDRIITIALTFYPIGAVFAPMVASSIVNSSLQWRYIYVVLVGVILLVMALYLVITRKIKYAEGREKQKFGLKEIFHHKTKNLLLILISIAVIFYGISETVISTWSPTFFRMVRSFEVGQAGFVGSLFFISIIIGRIIVGSLAGKVRNTTIMTILASIAVISASFSLVIDSNTLIFVGIFFTGLGFSGLFPLLLSEGNKVFDKGKDLIATILFASGNLGISIAPFLTRAVSQYHLFLSVFLTVIFMAVLLVLVISQGVVKKTGYKNI